MKRTARTWMIHQQQQHCKLQGSKQEPLGEYHVVYGLCLTYMVCLLWIAWLATTAARPRNMLVRLMHGFASFSCEACVTLKHERAARARWQSYIP